MKLKRRMNCVNDCRSTTHQHKTRRRNQWKRERFTCRPIVHTVAPCRQAGRLVGQVRARTIGSMMESVSLYVDKTMPADDTRYELLIFLHWLGDTVWAGTPSRIPLAEMTKIPQTLVGLTGQYCSPFTTLVDAYGTDGKIQQTLFTAPCIVSYRQRGIETRRGEDAVKDFAPIINEFTGLPTSCVVAQSPE